MNLGKFEVTEELGKGGFGIVYKALDKVLNRQVALKVLHPELLINPDFILRFKHEAQLAAQLDHPNLLPVYEFNEFEGRYYIVMAYMPDGSLKDLLKKEGTLDKQRSLKIFEQICDGMSYAHSQKIIHRDLKPGNILFDNRGNARISDMGFAKMIHNDSSGSPSLSVNKDMVGTPSYMAPEIWDGKGATSATDVYSLACVLVEMLTGEALFIGESMPEIMKKHLEPLQLPEDLPEKWKPVLEAALEKQQEERIQTVEEFLEQIKKVEKSENTENDKRKTKFGLIFAVFVLLAIIIGVVLFQAGKNLATPASIAAPFARATPEATSKSPIMTAVNTPMTTTVPVLGIGSTQIRDTDGMEQVYVPAGDFIMGSKDGDSDADDDEKPERLIYLDTYWIDKYEVSNGQYQECVENGPCRKPEPSRSRTRSSYYGNAEFDNYPVIYVDWYQAKDYCEWVGGDLPTEAQWEKAARGIDGRKYPWGNQEPDSNYANYSWNIGDTSEVGSYEKGASPYGAMDMAGNASEWANDWYDDKYNANDTYNPQGPENVRYYRILRGGNWHDGSNGLRTAYRLRIERYYRYEYTGFRCVSSP